MNILEDIKAQYKTGGVVQKLIFWNIGVFVFFALLDVFLRVTNSIFDYYNIFS